MTTRLKADGARRTRGWLARVGLTAALVSPLALAQGGGAQPAADLTAESMANLTPQQMIERAGTLLGNVLKNVKLLETLVEKAKQEADIIKVNCTSDKFVQATANQKIAEQANSALSRAANDGDVEGARHEYTRIVIIDGKVMVLVSEGNECIGVEAGYVGQLMRSTQVGEEVRRDDVTVPANSVINSERPPVTSPS